MTFQADASFARRDRKPWLARLADAAQPYLYSAPVLILDRRVMLVPLTIGISYAFRDIQLLNPFSGGFIGLDHFRELAKDAARSTEPCAIRCGGPALRSSRNSSSA